MCMYSRSRNSGITRRHVEQHISFCCVSVSRMETVRESEDGYEQAAGIDGPMVHEEPIIYGAHIPGASGSSDAPPQGQEEVLNLHALDTAGESRYRYAIHDLLPHRCAVVSHYRTSVRPRPTLPLSLPVLLCPRPLDGQVRPAGPSTGPTHRTHSPLPPLGDMAMVSWCTK